MTGGINIANVLKQLRRTSGRSTKDVAAQLEEYGISISGKTLYGYESGLSMPNADTFLALCRIYNCDNPLDLLGSTRLDPVEQEHLSRYRQLDTYGKAAVNAVMEKELERVEEQTARPAGKLLPLPKSVWPASAGTGAYLGPEEMETIFVSDTPLTRQAAFCVPVQGNSMEPRYHDGDLLLVEGADDVEPGEVGIFTIDGDGYVKVRGNGELVSLNPNYPNIPMTESIWCNGRVIGTLDPALIEEGQ